MQDDKRQAAEPRAPAETRRVLLCSGKVYYDLVATRQILGADHVAIHRIEQLYPLQRRDTGTRPAPTRRQTLGGCVRRPPISLRSRGGSMTNTSSRS